MFRTQTRVGGDLVRSPVSFSHDEKIIFSCVGGVIKAHNAATGALHGEYRGHTARVSGVYLNPLNTLQLYSTSHDGTICRWDPMEAVCLQTYNIGIPVLAGSIAAGHHLYVALDPTHYTKFLPDTNTQITQNTSSQSTSSSSSSSPSEKLPQITNQSNLPTTTSTAMTDGIDSISNTNTNSIDNTQNSQQNPQNDPKMASSKEEQRAKNIAFSSSNGKKVIYICAFNLLTPQNTDISTDFFSIQDDQAQVSLDFIQNTNSKNKKNEKNINTNNTQSASSTTNTTTISNNDNNPLQLLFTMKEFTAMARSRSGDLLCAVGGREIHVFSKNSRTHGVTTHPHPITCVDIHPKQDLIAIGDITGRITLYINASGLLTHSIDSGDNLTHLNRNTGGGSGSGNKNMITSGKIGKIVTSSLHWHSHPVRSAKFSVDGNYLLSGGYEGVLVTWQLSNMTPHFLPRLSSFIQHVAVSPKGGVYALSCGDNSIQTLGAFNSQLKHVAHGVNILNPTNRLIETPHVAVLGEKNKVLLITDQGHFQVFDIAQDLHVCTFNLLDRNLLPENQLQQHLKQSGSSSSGGSSSKYNSSSNQQSLTKNALNNNNFTLEQQQHAQRISASLDITKVIISPSGRWSCGFYDSPSKQGLRIWAHSSELIPSTEFISRTVWHDNLNYRAISGTFSQNSEFLITGHSDGRVRLWNLTTASDSDQRYPQHLKYMAQTWVIENTIEFQGLPPTVIVLSNDMTLMAIGFGNTFTLWSIDRDDSFNTTFLFSHTFAGAYTEVLSICFLPQYPTIYVATQHGIYTFDLLTLSCVGTYFCNIAGMITHPTLPLLFVMTVVPLFTSHKLKELQKKKKKEEKSNQIIEPEQQQQQQQQQQGNLKRNKNKKQQQLSLKKASPTTKTAMNDSDGSDLGDSDNDDYDGDDIRTKQELTKADDYLGDQVDALIAQNDNTTPGATGSDIKCPIYRRLFKYLYRTHIINRYVDPITKHIPSIRTLPQDKLYSAQKDLKITLPQWSSSITERNQRRYNRSRDIDDEDVNLTPVNNNNNNQNIQNKINIEKIPLKYDLLTKPTKECCLLVFRDNHHESPEYATSLYDVMLTKTKITNINNNPYNSSCYEASTNLTQDFFTYLNRSRELTLIPITPQGVSIIQQNKNGSNSVQSNGTSSILKDIYQLETHSAKLSEATTLPSDFTLTGGSGGAGGGSNDAGHRFQQKNPQLDALLGTLANTPTHQITSLSAVYEQFMKPFLPTQGK